MAKSNKPKELTTEITQDEKAMDELTNELTQDEKETNELITNLTEESKVESDAVETILETTKQDEAVKKGPGVKGKNVPLTSEDSFTAPVIPALPISVLRDLAKSRPLTSKINRLLDEVEQAFTH